MVTEQSPPRIDSTLVMSGKRIARIEVHMTKLRVIKMFLFINKC